MRKIKFRVRCNETKAIIGYEEFNTCFDSGYVYYLESEKYEEEDGSFDYPCHSEYSYPPMPRSDCLGLSYVIREQYAGLKCKNGVEIYEGDIVHIHGYGLYECEFPFREIYDAYPENDIGDIKGNIYENPELLYSED